MKDERNDDFAYAKSKAYKDINTRTIEHLHIIAKDIWETHKPLSYQERVEIYWIYMTEINNRLSQIIPAQFYGIKIENHKEMRRFRITIIDKFTHFFSEKTKYYIRLESESGATQYEIVDENDVADYCVLGQRFFE